MMTGKSPWNVYRTRFLVRARQLTEPLLFTDSLGREHSGRPGDYLVETSDGIRRITTQTLFEDIYVPLAADQAPPACVTEISERTSQPRPATRISNEDSTAIRHRATA